MRREPLNDTEVDTLAAQLFRSTVAEEDQVLYAVLDGARDRRIHLALRSAGVPWVCLFSGALVPALQAAAPYLVQLRRSAPLVRFILQNGWGNAWGIFARSTATLEEMRRHLRRFLRVADPNGKHLFFRYYDPRVLRVYLPMCTEEELATVFGPVDRFSLEAEERGWLIEHAVKRRRLTTAEVEVGATEPTAETTNADPD